MHQEQRETMVDQERLVHARLRAEHVASSYFARHPDFRLAAKVHDGTLSLTEAYEILVQSARDPKTDVQRADLLGEVMEYEMYHTRQVGHPFSVAVFDIDDFKAINQELTHVTADDVLKEVATIIADTVRGSDGVLPGDEGSVVRWGGEEFVVILTGADRDQAHQAADRIRQRVQQELTGRRPQGKPVTVSGGLVEFSPDTIGDWKTLLKTADQQLLAAKESGKNIIFPSAESAAA